MSDISFQNSEDATVGKSQGILFLATLVAVHSTLVTQSLGQSLGGQSFGLA